MKNFIETNFNLILLVIIFLLMLRGCTSNVKYTKNLEQIKIEQEKNLNLIFDQQLLLYNDFNVLRDSILHQRTLISKIEKDINNIYLILNKLDNKKQNIYIIPTEKEKENE